MQQTKRYKRCFINTQTVFPTCFEFLIKIKTIINLVHFSNQQIQVIFFSQTCTNIIPYIYLKQNMSKKIKKREAKFHQTI